MLAWLQASEAQKFGLRSPLPRGAAPSGRAAAEEAPRGRVRASLLSAAHGSPALGGAIWHGRWCCREKFTARGAASQTIASHRLNILQNLRQPFTCFNAA